MRHQVMSHCISGAGHRALACVATIILAASLRAQIATDDQLKEIGKEVQAVARNPISPADLGPLGLALPDWNRRPLTFMGSVGNDRRSWQMSTAIICTPGGFGSGAVVTDDGLIVTNYHVVENECQLSAVAGRVPDITAIFPQEVDGVLVRKKQAISLEVVKLQPRSDLALLRPSNTGEGKFTKFEFADRVDLGAECYVIGSQGGGIAWAIRSGTTASIARFPSGVTEEIIGASNNGPYLQRTRAKIVVSDCSISNGDSGGPVVNKEGKLVGVTFATPTNRASGAMGYHLHVDEVRALMSPESDALSAWPWDVWTLGDGSLKCVGPKIIDIDSDGKVDALCFAYLDHEHELVGLVFYVSAQQGITAPALQREAVDHPTVLLPRALWDVHEAKDPHGFAWDLALAVITKRSRLFPEGAIAKVTRGSSGAMDCVAVDSNALPDVELSWCRDEGGKWMRRQHAGGASWASVLPMTDHQVSADRAIHKHLSK